MSNTPARKRYDVERVARGARFSSFGQVAGRALGYATQFTLARMYGPSLLGLYVLGVTVATAANILAQFGTDSGLVRYVAHYRAEGDTPRVKGTILLALWLTFTLSLAISGLIFIGAGFLAQEVFGESSLNNIFRTFSISVPFFTVMTTALWATQGFQTVKYYNLVQEFLRPLINLGLVVLFYLVSSQILGAVFAYLISMIAGAFLALYYLVRMFPELLDRSVFAKYEPRQFMSVSAPMSVANLTPYIGSWVAVAVLGIFATAGEVGLYNVASRTAALSAMVLLTFRNIFSPMVSELHGRGLMDELGRLYRDVSRWVFTGSLAGFLLTVLLAKDIMAVFGPGFIRGWTVLVIISGGELLISSIGPTDRVLAMTGHQKVVMSITVLFAISNVLASVLLVPLYGVIGAAMALVIAIVLATVARLVYVRRLLRLWPYNRRYLKPLLAGLLGVVGAYAVGMTLPSSASILRILILTPVFLTAFAGLLLALGLSPSDRQLFRSLLSTISHKDSGVSNERSEP